MVKKQHIRLAITLLAISIALVSCVKEKDDPRVKTTSIALQDDMSYNIKASVLSKGDYDILDYGFEYAYSSTPDAYSSTFLKKSIGKVITKDTFSCDLAINYSSFYGGAHYFCARAYVTNEKGTIYANVLSAELPQMSISAVTPKYAQIGDTVKIIGTNFAPTAIVTFSSIPARVISVTKTEITVIVPNASYGEYNYTYVNITVSMGNQNSSLSYLFTVEPTLTSFFPKNGTWNTNINITGQNLLGSSIFFDDTFITNVSSSSTSVYAAIPTTFYRKQFKVYVSKGEIKKEVPGGYFSMNKIATTFTPDPTYLPGTNLLMQVTNGNPNYSSNFLLLGSTKIFNNSYSNTSQSFTISTLTAEGEYSLKLSNYYDTILITPKLKIVKPKITDITSTSGLPGSSFTIQGEYFANAGIAPSIFFDQSSISGIITSYDSTKINIRVPWIQPKTYTVAVRLGNFQVSSPKQFTIIEPTISSISPSSGAAGTSVIINGQGFGTSYTATVYFGNLSATALSQTDTQINVKVPASITSGTWLVKVKINGYELSSTTTFVVP